MTKEAILESHIKDELISIKVRGAMAKNEILEAMQEYADSLLSERWVSMEDGLPGCGQQYIVAYFNPSDADKKLYVITLWLGRYGWCFDRNIEQEMAEDSTLTVAYYQPLPSPPITK